jgi:hypothetical protein
MMQTTRKTLALALVGLLGLAACGDGGGGSDADEEAYVDAIAAKIYNPTFSGDERRCVAGAFVDATGLDVLSDAVTPEEITENPDAELEAYGIELTDERAQALYDGMSECVDIREALVGSMAAEHGMSPDAQACLGDAFDDALLRDLMVTGVAGGDDAIEQDPELTERLRQAITPCAQLDGAA